jgi:hypothetical protein
MNSVAQEMMALLKSKPAEEQDSKAYTSGMTPDMYDQSDMVTNHYDEEEP